MDNLKVLGVACPCVLFVFFAVVLAAVTDVDQTAGSAKDRRKSGFPPVGYSDTLLVPGQKWRVHDINRPEPGIITPGLLSTTAQAGRVPSDGIVLFDGTDLSNWVVGKGQKAAGWKVENGFMEVNGTGSILTKEGFGSCQLHLEWAAPEDVAGDSQGRGNSGVMLMSYYEVQILDSYNNRTYSDGQAAAIYGQYPPLVNASRSPGEWQTYDIIFEAPEFDGDIVSKPAYVTVIHNGVVVHHKTKIVGRVAHRDPAVYVPHSDKLPLLLQDHGNPVRFRNIWIRPLTGYDES